MRHSYAREQVHKVKTAVVISPPPRQEWNASQKQNQTGLPCVTFVSILILPLNDSVKIRHWCREDDFIALVIFAFLCYL